MFFGWEIAAEEVQLLIFERFGTCKKQRLVVPMMLNIIQVNHNTLQTKTNFDQNFQIFPQF